MQKKTVYKIFILFFAFILTLSSYVFAEDSDLNIDAKSAILIDYSSGKVLYEKSMHNKMYPASVTKVLTAIIVLEKCKLDDIITITDTAISNVEFGYVTANLKVGEQVTVEQLLNLLLIPSANDAALVLAEYVGGSIDEFSDLMNKKATELGCTDSHFVNPNGMHNENHYSSAYDLALIGKYAMQFETIKDISSKTYFSLAPSNIYTKDDRIFTTTNDLIIPSNSNYYKYAIGIKTGFTTPAGNCLMSYSERNGLSFISVILGASTSNSRFLDVKNLFEYGYDNYYVKKIGNVNDAIQTINIKNATYDTKKLNALLAQDIDIVLKNNESMSSIKSDIKFNTELKAPINKGEVIGSITYYSDGISYSSYLIAGQNVQKSHLLLVMFCLFIVLFIIIIGFKIRNSNLKKKRLQMIKKI